VKNGSTLSNLNAVVLVIRPDDAEGIVTILEQRGFSATVKTDPEMLLGQCQSDAPHLAVVEDRLGSMTGAKFLSELLKISWTTASILICDEEAEVVHERTEGLGILGSIRSVRDFDGLGTLLTRFFELV
jgi:DNA-binding response OmpR family regulator